MAEKKKKGFLSRIKDSLKIKKRGLSGANAELRRKRGRTLKSKTKMASFREDNKANKRLQAESKDARKDYTTYTKVSKKNKAKLSDQHKVKTKDTPKTKSKTVRGRKLSPYEMRQAERKKAMQDRARKRHAEFKAARAAKRKK